MDFKDIRKENLLKTEPVPSEKTGVRVDKWLSEITDFSRSRISSLIDSENVFYENGDLLKSSDKKVVTGDSFLINVPEPVPAVPVAQDLPLEVVYEDDDILVINKAAGMVVHPACGNYEGTLVNALLAYCKDSLSGIGGVIRPGIVHRLDKDTSGLMVVAKNDLAHQKLSEQFSVHSLDRCYLAIVWGVLNPPNGIVDNFIGRNPNDRKKMAVVQNGGKHAVTHYKLIKVLYNGAASLVECSLKTGRTHQVRVHMTSIGHPLIGDATYGRSPRGENKNESIKKLKAFPRQALHSYKIRFIHPITNKEMFFEIPLPKDMNDIVK
ncbi:MAG: RluA family pseudouridine synthase [Alphaproteobacteria bacterium]|nr:RluA family pseudouridine synthase [Alphaproteobacteria bacterium]